VTQALENACGRLAVPQHVAADHAVEGELAGAEVLTEPTRLAMAEFGQAVVVAAAEGGLRMANQEQFGGHGNTQEKTQC
jgi:hypothetical protein